MLTPLPAPAVSVGNLANAASARRPAHRHSARALAAMLLAAIVSALVVAADALIDAYADGHLLLAWSALWAVGFASMALFADAARAGARHLMVTLRNWREQYARRIADDALLAVALRDPRIMADLQSAIERERSAREFVQLAHGRAWLEHRPLGTLNAAYTGPRRLFKLSPLTGLPMHMQYFPR